MVKKRFDALLFDLDGTLIDPRVGITRSIQYALQKLGKTNIPEEVDLLWTIGPPLRENFAKLIETDDKALVEQGMVYFRERFGEVGLFENEIYPDVLELLDQLTREGFPLYLATSKPHPYAVRILKHHHLDGYFIKTYGSEFDGTRSDKGQLLAYLMMVEGNKVAKSLMIGDRLHDIRAAKQNQLAGAGVTYGYGSTDELLTAGADFLVEAPLDLLKWVWIEK